MRLRKLIALVAIATVWPLIAQAQPQRPVIGVLSSASPERFAHLIVAFREGLQELGYRRARMFLSNIAGRMIRLVSSQFSQRSWHGNP